MAITHRPRPSVEKKRDPTSIDALAVLGERALAGELVVVDGALFGKPRGDDDARRVDALVADEPLERTGGVDDAAGVGILLVGLGELRPRLHRVLEPYPDRPLRHELGTSRGRDLIPRSIRSARFRVPDAMIPGKITDRKSVV